MKQFLDAFQGQIASNFRELILAIAYLNIGGRLLSGTNPDASVELFLDEDIRTEPLHVRELIPHTNSVAEGVLEHYQSKMVAAWSDLLAVLFAEFVRLHVAGTRHYREIGKRKTQVDFSDTTDMRVQIEQGLVAEFSFESYGKRVRTVNGVLNSEGKHAAELSIVKKHVLIRNAVQHHSSKVYAHMLRELGSADVTVLDGNAKQKTFGLNTRIALSIPELDLLKRSLFRLSNEWRAHCG